MQELLEAATGSFYHCMQLLKTTVVDPHPIKITTKLQAADSNTAAPFYMYRWMLSRKNYSVDPFMVGIGVPA